MVILAFGIDCMDISIHSDAGPPKLNLLSAPDVQGCMDAGEMYPA